MMRPAPTDKKCWLEGVPVGKWVRWSERLVRCIFGGGRDLHGDPGFKGVFGQVYKTNRFDYHWELVTKYDYGIEIATAEGYPPLEQGRTTFAFTAKRRCRDANVEYHKWRDAIIEELRIRRARANYSGPSGMAFAPTGSSKLPEFAPLPSCDNEGQDQ